MKISLSHGFLPCLILLHPAAASACSRVMPISIVGMCAEAELVVRAVATAYEVPPLGPGRTTGQPESVVRFRIVEVIEGSYEEPTLLLNGYLGDRDDFNDHAPPYTFVRRGGRSGSCFANTYRRDAQYLLLLRRRGDAYTVDWNALAPVNEQLRSDTDPWLLWVKGALAGLGEITDPGHVGY